MAAGDLDSDGEVDLLVMLGSGYGLQVLWGLDEGTLSPAATLPAYGASGPVAALDVNGDTNLDIVAGFGSAIGVMLGNGDRTFTAPAGYASAASIMGVADLNADGAPDIVTASNGGDYATILLARRDVKHSPVGDSGGPVDRLQVHFRPVSMDTDSFSIDDDIVRFVGPNGSIDIDTASWSEDRRTLDLTFSPQTTPGDYELIISPDVLDSQQRPLNLDGDNTAGEFPEDQYVAMFTITGPRIVAHSPNEVVGEPVESLTLEFDHMMREESFLPLEDDFALSGPRGPIEFTGYQLIAGRTFELSFPAQSESGSYTLLVDPSIQDVAGNPVDQDKDGSPGEEIEDRYVAAFEVDLSGPFVFLTEPQQHASSPLQQIVFHFNEPLDARTVQRDDVISFTGPDGQDLLSQLWYWPTVSGSTVTVKFAAQTVEGRYTMALSPQMSDLIGNEVDQNMDGVAGQLDDQILVELDLRAADLAIDLLSPPSGGLAGDELTVSWRACNTGEGAAIGVWGKETDTHTCWGRCGKRQGKRQTPTDVGGVAGQGGG